MRCGVTTEKQCSRPCLRHKEFCCPCANRCANEQGGRAGRTPRRAPATTPRRFRLGVRDVLEFVPAEKLWITPDCGFFQLPRWLAFQKVQNMVKGVEIVRKELAG